jgi:hypothetical protein
MSQQEHPESHIQPLLTDILGLWALLVMSLNPNCKVIEPQLADPRAVYKSPLPFRQEVRYPFPPFTMRTS